ncbi:hypothetical protein [Deinococcus navajonensis]|uniref:Uncharacterized protein n=1 Tax=Deinococcus navajonensis TaxID=309884 RepID=A0ABV8XQ50_9DEIO
MEHDINAPDLSTTRLPDLRPPQPVLPSTPAARLLNALAVRPALARSLSDGMILLVVCLGGLGAVVGLQKLSAPQRPPLAGMAELHAQMLSMPPVAHSSPAAVAPAGPTAAGPPVRQRQAERSAKPDQGAQTKQPEPGPAELRLARPITGQARQVVLQLTRAAGFILPDAVLARSTATADVASMLAAVGRPVPARTLLALQNAPSDPARIAELTRQLREVTPAAAATQGRGATRATTSAPNTLPEASSTALRAGVSRQDEDIAAHPPSAEAATPSHLQTTLDDPLPVNQLQVMTEQAVTPLTPRN